MELTRLRDSIIKLLYEHIQRPVVMINQVADKPLTEDKSKVDYPFISYKFITSIEDDEHAGTYIQEEVASTNPNFKVDILETVKLQVKFTISFSIYGNDSTQTKELALKTWEFFKHKAYYDFARENIIVVDVSNIQNRDVFEVDGFERREGFDVIFRTSHNIQRRLETIETYKVERKEG